MKIDLQNGTWLFNGLPANQGSPAEGLLLNVRMANAAFRDRARPEIDSDSITARFIAAMPDYVASGVNAFTVGLQGGMPGYEGARCSAFLEDGELDSAYLKRVERIIGAADNAGAAIILCCYYRRQDDALADTKALHVGIRNAARWLTGIGRSNILFEVANEFGHYKYHHAYLQNPAGIVALIDEARQANPELLVSSSRQSHRGIVPELCEASDFILIHFNQLQLERYPDFIAELKRFGKAIVCNEDAKIGAEGAAALDTCVENGISWGYMNNQKNQHYPFSFDGPQDDPEVYTAFKRAISTR